MAAVGLHFSGCDVTDSSAAIALLLNGAKTQFVYSSRSESEEVSMQAIITTALALTALFVSVAAAQTTKYGDEAGWEILVKSDMGPGCLIAKSNPDDLTQLQMGIDATSGLKGYMAIYTKKDTNIAAGQQLSVIFEVDDEKFTGEAKGQQVGDYVGAFVWVNNPEFIYNLAKKKTLTITSPGRNKLVVNLQGTDAAFDKLRACQAAQ